MVVRGEDWHGVWDRGRGGVHEHGRAGLFRYQWGFGWLMLDGASKEGGGACKMGGVTGGCDDVTQRWAYDTFWFWYWGE